VGTGPRHPPHPGTAPPGPAAHAQRGHPGQPERQDPRTGGRHGYDGAKKLNGRKRHLLVDTLGLVCKVQVTAANVGDRDGAMALLGRRGRWLPPGATPPIVSPFAVVPRRWVVERTFAWLGRYRRLSKEYEYLTATSEAVIYLVMTRLLLRRLTQP
jgi:putative transposase